MGRVTLLCRWCAYLLPMLQSFIAEYLDAVRAKVGQVVSHILFQYYHFINILFDTLNIYTLLQKRVVFIEEKYHIQLFFISFFFSYDLLLFTALYDLLLFTALSLQSLLFCLPLQQANNTYRFRKTKGAQCFSHAQLEKDGIISETRGIPMSKYVQQSLINMNSMGPHNIFHINRSFILIGGLIHT